jgi:hypothetical protein
MGKLLLLSYRSFCYPGKKAEATAKLSLGSCNKKISDQLANRDFIYLLLVLGFLAG